MGSVFHGGLLAGAQPGGAFDDVAPETRARIARLDALCAEFGIAVKAAALQFPLGHPAVACVLTGVRSQAELDENLAAFRQPIPRAFWDRLREAGLLPSDVPYPGD
jgi:D-threo-aldose 1-dehydrogenase